MQLAVRNLFFFPLGLRKGTFYLLKQGVPPFRLQAASRADPQNEAYLDGSDAVVDADALR